MRQYDTKNTVSGYKECTFCKKVVPVIGGCDCCVRIKITGDFDNVKTMFEILFKQFEIVAYDRWEQEDKRTGETYIWLAIRPPSVLKLGEANGHTETD